MIKMDSQYDNLDAIWESIENIVSDLKKEKNNIDQNTRGRFLTAEEREMYKEIENQIDDLFWCVEHIISAKSHLVDYIDK